MWAIAPTQDRDGQGNRVGTSLKLPRIFIEKAGHHDSFVAFKMAPSATFETLRIQEQRFSSIRNERNRKD